MLSEYVEYIKTLFKPDAKIVVAMSGGVDSSLTAALIKRAGFETIGVTLQLYRSDVARGKTCCAGKDIQDAKDVAAAEDFSHYVLDYTTIFKEKVIDDFVNTYEAGKTPIPCGRCNQYVKFGDLLNFTNAIGADYLVTGHYAQKMGDEIHRSVDANKDQTYFLALTTKEQFAKLYFPLAKIEKTIVKELANLISLPTAKKAESQDICFIPDGDYKSFLYKLRPEMFVKGNVVTRSRQILGEHAGLAGYTVGQRKNLNLSTGPWYVLKLDTANNELVVGREDEQVREKFKLTEVNLLIEKEYFDKAIEIQVRARHMPVRAWFDLETNVVQCVEKAITPGQICAFYDGARLLGGGIIDKILE